MKMLFWCIITVIAIILALIIDLGIFIYGNLRLLKRKVNGK